jgi:hypothetical protein
MSRHDGAVSSVVPPAASAHPRGLMFQVGPFTRTRQRPEWILQSELQSACLDHELRRDVQLDIDLAVPQCLRAVQPP